MSELADVLGPMIWAGARSFDRLMRTAPSQASAKS